MKKLSRSHFYTLIICGIAGIVFGTVASLIGSEKIEGFDLPIIHFVQGMETPWLTAVFKTFTWIGSAYAVVPVTAIAFFLLFFVYKHRQQAFLFVTVVVGTITLNELLKRFFKRDRPEIYRIMDAGGFSFPSGHTMMAFSLYAIIAYIAWRNIKSGRNRILLILFTVFMAFMIAISRIYLGVHYPSDVVGGIAVSAIWVTISIFIYGAYQNPKENNKAESS